MMSWNEMANVGFVAAYDNDIIAHEKKIPSAVDGIFCAFHGGAGYLNNWLFENTRLENFQYSLFSITIACVKALSSLIWFPSAVFAITSLAQIQLLLLVV